MAGGRQKKLFRIPEGRKNKRLELISKMIDSPSVEAAEKTIKGIFLDSGDAIIANLRETLENAGFKGEGISELLGKPFRMWPEKVWLEAYKYICNATLLND